MGGFKNFILRGNLVDLAVAVIIGMSFGAVVTAFTNLLTAAIAKISNSNPDFSAYTPGGLPVGLFVNAVVAFLILAAVIYFFVVVPYTKAREKYFPSPAPGTPEDITLLKEIRDLLATQANAGSAPKHL